MMQRKNISVFILGVFLSLTLLLIPSEGYAQFGRKKKNAPEVPDTTAFFNGFAVSADLLGPAMQWLNDYGTYEGALRINLKDRWFPVVELGIGRADHADVATQTSYKTTAPFGRIGVDFNLMKDKHDLYRIFAGARYAYTKFKFDINHPEIKDPVWGDLVIYEAKDLQAYYHWLEVVFGVDASIWGPIHLGWSVRYKNRIAHDDGPLDNCWYVPGFGITGKTAFGGSFNIIIDI